MEVLLATLHVGDKFGDVSFIEGSDGLRQSTVTAREDTELLALAGEHFIRTLRAHVQGDLDERQGRRLCAGGTLGMRNRL